MHLSRGMKCICKRCVLQTDPDNDNQVLIPQSRYCESAHMWYFAGILYAIKGSGFMGPGQTTATPCQHSTSISANSMHV